MLKVSFAAIIILLFSSCHDVKKREQLEEVGKMIAAVDSMQKMLQEPPADSVRKVASSVSAVLLAIRESYRNDTLSLELAGKLDAYKMILTDLDTFREINRQIEAGILEERPGLVKLQEDISTGAGDRARYSEYIRFEKNKVAQLAVLLQSREEVRTRYMNIYHELHDEMKELGRTGNFNA